MPEQPVRARLVDVADRAGVSKATVSKVLNGRQDLNVRPETRRRVHEAAEALGYRPHSGARALAGASTHALALLVPALDNPTYVTIARGAYQRARELGYLSLLAEDFDGQEADESFNDLVQEGRVDGLLIASARPGHPLLEALRGNPVPHVFLNRSVEGSGRNVTMDVARSSVTALDHLHGLGHRAVGHIAGPPGITPSDTRKEAFLRHAGELGLAAAPVASGDFTEDGGRQAALELLRPVDGDGRPPVTALYTSSLAQAMGTMAAIRSLGLRVPEDVSVIGNDDLPVAAHLHPPLTTVAMPLYQLGTAAVDALVAAVQGTPPGDVVVPTEPRLVLRDSTARPVGPGGTP
ncbi:LacI family DNA-binding transcriptional regulator [Streptomyces sp. NL15-2K]|uniref:LacI family DNA-binding transcriptional regulator n=1 Tax=Streptomyces sp. NL15-2K TaxID=376149 RepID=UPI000F58BDE2|nr:MULTISPECIES: LacI family DNA-binding transcriptional regulator [Actinomycetes]WKX06732.1 LacI family DNA-binding transcriptional regulator [Kutzneria buriramensis]GCB52530.1 lacI family transcriptional regulator [Streptomyces sp. NL15-2K]